MTGSQQVVGLIGIGALGLPIAVNLIQAGYSVVGYRRSEREAFIAAGGIAVDTPAEVAQRARTVLLCLPSEAAQREVLDGPHGLAPALGAEHVVVELGTYRQAFKTELAARLQAVGTAMLEAEVSGSPPMVAQRRAALYIGGEPALYRDLQPLLEAITAHHFHLGGIGAAVTMKLISNTLVAIHTLAAAEAVAFGQRAGFDPRLVAEVLSQGSGASTMFGIRAPLMATRRFEPALGSFDTLHKYLVMGRELADEVGSVNPLFDAAAPYFLKAIDEGDGALDIAAVIRQLEAASASSTS